MTICCSRVSCLAWLVVIVSLEGRADEGYSGGGNEAENTLKMLQFAAPSISSAARERADSVFRESDLWGVVGSHVFFSGPGNASGQTENIEPMRFEPNLSVRQKTLLKNAMLELWRVHQTAVQKQYAVTQLVDTFGASADKMLREVEKENRENIQAAEAKFSGTVTEVLVPEQLALAVRRLQLRRMRGLFFVNYSWANEYFELSEKEIAKLRDAELTIRRRVNTVARKQLKDGLPLVPSEKTKRFIDTSLLVALKDLDREKILEIWRTSGEAKEKESWDAYWARQSVAHQRLKNKIFADQDSVSDSP